MRKRVDYFELYFMLLTLVLYFLCEVNKLIAYSDLEAFQKSAVNLKKPWGPRSAEKVILIL